MGAPLELVGLCDTDADRLPAGSVACYTNILEAVGALDPTVVCVTVNEGSHATVFEQLRDLPRILVLSEKPLATSLAEAEQACPALANHAFSMNMVERFSPVTRGCLEWLDAEGPFEIVRVESFWGKHRIGDRRPTMGVLSEVIHALDLSRLLFAQGQFRPTGGLATSSDFSPWSDALMDSIDVIASVGKVPLIVHSSFVWARRMRVISAVLRSQRDQVFRVELDFDNPKWDCDRLEITSIGPNGHLTAVHLQVTDVSDLPQSVHGVGKVATFIDTSIRVWRGGHAPRPPLACLATVLELQRDMEAIAAIVANPMCTSGYRSRSRV